MYIQIIRQQEQNMTMALKVRCQVHSTIAIHHKPWKQNVVTTFNVSSYREIGKTSTHRVMTTRTLTQYVFIFVHTCKRYNSSGILHKTYSYFTTLNIFNVFLKSRYT